MLPMRLITSTMVIKFNYSCLNCFCLIFLTLKVSYFIFLTFKYSSRIWHGQVIFPQVTCGTEVVQGQFKYHSGVGCFLKLIDATTAPSLKSCTLKCAKNTECRGFNYLKSTSDCLLASVLRFTPCLDASTMSYIRPDIGKQ